jgi:malate dehydrogenase (oxaloacetate-decarboxylating)(NADP+)
MKNIPLPKKGLDVNTLIFPNLLSAYTTHKMLLEIGVGESVGLIQIGLNKPIHIKIILSLIQ